MKLELSKKNLPKIYLRNGKECFLCQIRKKLILVTHEEKVRQYFIKLLVEEFGYPIEYIDVEVPLSRFKKGQKGRADIVVYENAVPFVENKKALVIVECKMQSEIIDLYVHENQINKYNDVLDSHLQVLTNGNKIRAKERGGKEFQEMNLFPTYQSLLKRQKIKFIKPVPDFLYDKVQYMDNGVKVNTDYISAFDDMYKVNLPYKVLTNKKWIDAYYKAVSPKGYPIGKKTPKELYPYILRLMDVFYNFEFSIKALKIPNVKFIEDLGFRIDKFGYPTGELLGVYRYLMIKDQLNNTQIVSFAIYSTYQKTYLMVGLDDYEKKNHTLELCLDKHLIPTEGSKEFVITHDGRLTIAKSSKKKADVIIYIKKKAPYLIVDDHVMLGRFSLADNMWVENDTAIFDFYRRLIQYAILRNEFRKEQAFHPQK